MDMMASSSEIVDSVQKSNVSGGQKSNFSQTCSLLSQYLKEKGSFGELSLGLNRSFEFESNVVASKTMNLLPMLEKPSQNMEVPARNAAVCGNNKAAVNLFPQVAGFYGELLNKSDTSVVKSEPDTAQMTIFYGGQVLVFNDFPAEKAKEIMLLASNNKGCPVTGSSSNGFVPNKTTPKPAESASSLVVSPATTGIPKFGTGMLPESHQNPLYPRMNDLPLSRKASLTRFLEKRKDRITAKAPYQTNSSGSSKSAEKNIINNRWLGFRPAHFPSPLQMERLA